MYVFEGSKCNIVVTMEEAKKVQKQPENLEGNKTELQNCSAGVNKRNGIP